MERLRRVRAAADHAPVVHDIRGVVPVLRLWRRLRTELGLQETRGGAGIVSEGLNSASNLKLDRIGVKNGRSRGARRGRDRRGIARRARSLRPMAWISITRKRATRETARRCEPFRANHTRGVCERVPLAPNLGTLALEAGLAGCLDLPASANRSDPLPPPCTTHRVSFGRQAPPLPSPWRPWVGFAGR